MGLWDNLMEQARKPGGIISQVEHGNEMIRRKQDPRFKDNQVNEDLLDAPGWEGRRARREARRSARQSGGAYEAALNKYFMDRALAVTQGEDFREDPNELAEQAAAAQAASTAQQAAATLDLNRESMGAGGQYAGMVSNAIRSQLDGGERAYAEAYATQSAQDRQQSLALQQDAIRQGQVASAMENAKQKERVQMALQLLAGAGQGLAQAAAPAPTAA